MKASSPPSTFLALLLITSCRGELSALAPSLVLEPPALVQFAASRGVTLRCAARGEPPPTITWLADDGTTISDVMSLRRVYSNGTLELLPSTASDAYEAPATVRCRAASPLGVALSRDVSLQPVADSGWNAVISAPPAPLGGVAALTCGAARHDAFVRPEVWYRGERVLHLDPPSPNARHLVAGNTLLIRDVAASDTGAYSCLARHAVTGTTKRAQPARLTAAASSENSAPRLVSAGGELTVSAGHDVCLPCVATDIKQPHYTWYREVRGRLEALSGGGEAGGWRWGAGAAWCVRGARPNAAGRWVCRAHNALGDATAHYTLAVRDALSVSLTPTLLVAESGSTARFTCNASEGAALRWLHDGAPAGSGAELVLRGVARAHRGVYQCVARRGTDSAQASAELRLGESAPELHYTFIEQALRPGGGVSLRCAASGAPPPSFTWLLDEQPLDQFQPQHRYFMSSETSVTGDVVSVLNMSAVTSADGGRYTCRAHNERGHAQHSARLNIYGPPSIRALGPVRVVAGANATIYCPYAGYPISSVSWWRGGGAGVTLSGAGRASARGAELRLWPALAGDAGRYACSVAAPQGPAARRDIDIQVRNPPKISPFMFSSELTEGSAVQVLCGVSSGDKPIYFTWLKDDAPLPSNLQIEEKSLNEFSLLMFSDLSARHSGAYTCRVSNHAATVNYTANLSVKVAPTWATEPADTAVLLGAPLLVECAAKGHPAPTITWYRSIGDGVEGGEGAEQWEVVRGAEWGAEESAARARGGALSAGAAARALAGAYRCVADNGVGPPLAKHLNLTVHEPAHFEGGGSNVSIVRGHSATLACVARGDAPLDVHWSHHGERLDLASYRWAVGEARAGGALRSTLRLRAAERRDAGEYRCHARNHYGRSEQLLYLHVDEPPEAPRRLLLAGVGSRWVRLRWESLPTSRASPLTYTVIYTVLHTLPGAEARQNTVNLTVDTVDDDSTDAAGGRDLSARLDGLRPASAYSLRLAAANHVGESSHSEPLLFTTLEEDIGNDIECFMWLLRANSFVNGLVQWRLYYTCTKLRTSPIPSAPPQNIRVRGANPGELHVSWSAPLQDSWNGELLGYAVSWRELSQPEEDDAEDEEGSERRAGSATAAGGASVELTLEGLRPLARYALSVRAYTRAGAGPPSPAALASAPAGVPERAPRGLSCAPLSARSLRVRWTPPAGPHADALSGYDVHFMPVDDFSSSWGGGAGSVQTARGGPAREAALQGLRAATNYSVWVRARAAAGPGPPSPPVYCATADDVPASVVAVRALGCAADAVRVSWLAPPLAPRPTHYMLYTRELGKVGGEWATRVPADGAEAWREVRGLRQRAPHEFWVRAASAAGAGPASRAVSAAPVAPVSVRISSIGRAVHVARGARVRLPCAAVGAGPLHRRWSPLPDAHSLTDSGDLIIHKAEASSAGNYTCEVRGGGGADAVVMALVVRLPPAAPALRLERAGAGLLRLGWGAPAGRAPAAPLGYTLRWARAPSGAERVRRLPPGERELALAGLACGSAYRATLQAHDVAGDSPLSAPLLARTRGDKAQAPPGKSLVWANSTVLRLNLLAWGGRCPVLSWSITLRAVAGGAWSELEANGEVAEASNLQPGSWYEIRMVAHSPAGDTVALYKAATHTINGERLGEAVQLPAEARGAAADGGHQAEPGAAWRAGVAPALFGGGLALLLALLAGAAAARRAACCTRACPLRCAAPVRGPEAAPHPQLYSTEPSKRNGKTISSPDVGGELHEISPYATFSMSELSAGGGACALHLRTFGRAEPRGLAAPPPRPALRAAAEYGRARDSDSESSGSPCTACAAELYRLPAAHLSDTLPAAADGAPARARGGARARRRREARHAARSSVRYFEPAAACRAAHT